jgi:hypothetical protein
VLSLRLEARDFPHPREYDQYLEDSADYIFQLTYGTKQAQEAARVKMATWAAQHKEEIESSRRRMRAAAASQSSNAPPPPFSINAASTNAAAALSFSLPVLSAAPSSHISARQQISAISDPVKRRLEQVALDELERMAGGCKRAEEARRLRQDALEGLGWG